MKILLVSMNFSPELTGIGKYSGEMAEGLVDRGHDVTVVCAPPYYPTWSVGANYSSSAYVTENPRPGLTIRRCPVWIPDRLTGLKRLAHLASFALSSLPVLMNLVLWQPRIVFVVAPGLFTAPGAWLAARLSGAKAWLHIQDFEVDAAFELGMLKQPLARRGALWAERWLMRRFDAVSTISSRMVRQLARKGMPLQHTEVLPNWVDLSRITPQGSSPELRSALGISPSQTVCLFSGTINRKQGVGVLIEAARRLKASKGVVFVICGNGEVRPSLEAAAADLPNVRFIDLQPAAELNALLNMADIHLLPQLSGAADLVMPSKLAGMLASGRPVVAAAIPGTEIASIVVGCGIVTTPECAEGFAEAITSLAADAQRRQRLGAAARAYAERVLDAQVIFDRLDARLAQVDRQSVPLAAPQGSVRTARALLAPADQRQTLSAIPLADESK